ncbi:MAG: hypothetical protein B7Y04_04045 [Gallionellales bacterium 24-53-125]|nr:MAG: hypothetical protein B7Y04_04045 [Gallionellales bacterium 24-53-125]
MPVQATVKVKKISDIQTVPAYVGNQDEMIHAHIRQETEQMTASLESHLNKSNFIEVVPVRAEVEMPNDQDLDTSKSWSIEDIEKLGLGPGTQAVLSVNQIIECWNIRTNRPSQGTGLLQLKYL